ncbi:MAG: non-heme iron oxygenase ferredoxin subunit [Nitrosopumilus sp.]|nr:non-heme iron oxygenase ferredoxin subunit [Nitrosopumilus sp.]MDH3487390.1 non-heme iron oxygenase ferredoxin subunit [Nitrosopumilus sp.]
MGKILAGKTSDIPTGEMIKVSEDGKEILVANVDGNYYAMDDTCTHQGASLSEGTLEGSTVTCPWHGSTWDCKTGKLIAFASQLKDLASYKVIVESGSIYVET